MMYSIKRVEDIVLLKLQNDGIGHTIFTTYPWIQFLKLDQGIEPVVLELSNDGIVYSYFVGGIMKKMGIKILGSPFEGWLTCDMGFIRIRDFDILQSLLAVKQYAIEKLNCMYIQITDKKIMKEVIKENISFYETDVLLKDIAGSKDDVLKSFTRQGRRYIRQFYEREEVKEVAFDEEFIETYYKQLEYIFSRQGLKPTFSKDKIYHLAEVFKEYPQYVFAQKAFSKEGGCNGTALTFGFGDWCYYLCAAHNREQGNNHPGEGLFWEMTSHWNNTGIKNLDLVGVRDYKMRYNPSMKKVVTVYFEKYPGLFRMKNIAKRVIEIFRKNVKKM